MPPETEARAHHTLSAADALAAADVDENGLSSTEAQARLERYGPNTFTETKVDPTWLRFLRQYGTPYLVGYEVDLRTGIGAKQQQQACRDGD